MKFVAQPGIVERGASSLPNTPAPLKRQKEVPQNSISIYPKADLIHQPLNPSDSNIGELLTLLPTTQLELRFLFSKSLLGDKIKLICFHTYTIDILTPSCVVFPVV